MKKNCVICGKEGYSYFPFCYKHLQMKNEGKIIKCEDCGQWHLIDEPCDCERTITYTELPTEGFEKCVYCGASTTGYAFCRKCFKKFSTEEMLEILNLRPDLDDYKNSSDTNYDNEEDKEESADGEGIEVENDNELTCIICGKPSDGKHFCRSCYYANKNKILYLQIKQCKEFTKLDAEYESDFICDDGHLVKSPYEKIIDNWLYSEGIKHAYEKKIDIDKDRDLTPDFYIPELENGTKNVYVEFWGYDETNIKYQQRKDYKIKIYPELVKRDGIAVIYLNKKEVEKDTFKKKIKYAEQGKIDE